MHDEAIHQPSIRPYHPNDLDAVVDFWYDTWHATFPDLRHHEPKDAWRWRFETEIAVEERVFVAELDGRVVGLLAVKCLDDQRGYLHEIFVAPELQGRDLVLH